MNTSLTSPDEDHAKRLVKKAVSFYRAAGREIGLAEFMNPRGQFVRDDLYVFALDLDGKMLAHPINERFAGINFLEFRDPGGRSFIREIIEKAKREGSGFVEYRWYHPVSKEELPKTIYYERIDSIVVCGGFYHSEEHGLDSLPVSKEQYPVNFFELLEYLGA
jgi:cytochrome c